MTAVAERTETRSIPIELLVESPLNPRKHFDPEKLKELADSLQASGQLEAILVRPVGEQFEIAAGHRRYRAAKLAGLLELDARVREMDDKTFIECLTVSNLQRDDVHPLEEAQGYVQLMKSAGYKPAALAERVGKSEKYIYDRIKLLELTKPIQALFFAGEITAGHAILLARLSSSDQKRAIEEGVFETEDVTHDETGRLELELGRKPRSVREVAEWINDHVRLDATRPDTPDLFPRTHHAIEHAAKVVHITREFQVHPDARTDEKVFGPRSWKRVDGVPEEDRSSLTRRQVALQPCPHAVLGVIVIGPGRGEAFQVCVAKQKCTQHWPQARKEKSAKPASGSPSKDDIPSRRLDPKIQTLNDRAHKEDSERFLKARPKLLALIAEKIKHAPLDAKSWIANRLTSAGLYHQKDINRFFPAGDGAETIVRRAFFVSVLDELDDGYGDLKKSLGIELDAEIDRFAPPLSCKHCQCTIARACRGGCHWISLDPPVCSSKACAAKAGLDPLTGKKAADPAGGITLKKVDKPTKPAKKAKKK